MDIPPDSADSEAPPSELKLLSLLQGLMDVPSDSADSEAPRLTYSLTYRPHLVCLPQGSMDVPPDSADSEAPPSDLQPDLQTSPGVSAAGLDGRLAGLSRAGGAPV